MTLTDFLLARVAEDEAEVRAHGSTVVGHRSTCIFEGGYEGTLDCDCGGVERVLAECASKRLVLGMHQERMSEVRAYRSPRWQEVEDDINRVDRLKAEARGRVSSDIVQALAQVYADHEDFRSEWLWANR